MTDFGVCPNLFNHFIEVNYYLPLHQHPQAVKCSELLKILRKNGWFKISQKGSHLKPGHPGRSNIIIFPNHGSQEVGKGMQDRILKEAGLK